MNEGLIPSRYAKALFEVAAGKGEDSRLYDVMKTLETGFQANPGLQAVLANPYVAVADKEKLLITAAGVGAGDSLFNDFLKLLAQNRRLDMARQIALAYMTIYRRTHSIYEVKVTTAAPMSEKEEQRLKSLIQRHLGAGGMEFSSTVDSSLIGGFTVSVGNERIDASISNELKQLRLNLLSK